MERKIIDLGFGVAIMQQDEINSNIREHLTLMIPETETMLANCVEIHGLDSLTQLYRGLGEFIKEVQKGL